MAWIESHLALGAHPKTKKAGHQLLGGGGMVDFWYNSRQPNTASAGRVGSTTGALTQRPDDARSGLMADYRVPSSSPSTPLQKKRGSTGKRLRFAVFKRDHFTCQYCGAQPPDVVLVCDHIEPVAAGGASTIDNLITACESCNQGKADTRIGDAAIRPDADLLFLETQQEIAELRRYQKALSEREWIVAELIQTYQQLWLDTSGLDWHPSDTLMRQFLSRYSPEVVERTILDVAFKAGTGYLKTSYGNKWIAYMHAVARTMTEEEEG